MLTRRKLLASTPALAVAVVTPVVAACSMPIDAPSHHEHVMGLVDQLLAELEKLPGFRWWTFPKPNARDKDDYRGFALMFDHDNAFEFKKEAFEAVFPISALVGKAEVHMRKMQEAHKRPGLSDKTGNWYTDRFLRAYERVLGYVPRNFEETREKMAFLDRVNTEMGDRWFDARECEWLVSSFAGVPGTIVSKAAGVQS